MVETELIFLGNRVSFAPHRMGQTLADVEQAVQGIPVKRNSVNSPTRDQVQAFLREPHHTQAGQEREYDSSLGLKKRKRKRKESSESTLLDFEQCF